MLHNLLQHHLLQWAGYSLEKQVTSYGVLSLHSRWNFVLQRKRVSARRINSGWRRVAGMSVPRGTPPGRAWERGQFRTCQTAGGSEFIFQCWMPKANCKAMRRGHRPVCLFLGLWISEERRERKIIRVVFFPQNSLKIILFYAEEKFFMLSFQGSGKKKEV